MSPLTGAVKEHLKPSLEAIEGAVQARLRASATSLHPTISCIGSRALSIFSGAFDMKTLALIVVATLLLIPAASSVQAQTGGSSTSAKKSTKQPQANNLPRCSRAMKMSGKPCYGG
ncbi:hypothetical protein ACVIW2_007370 [Bradyrhizobium huanghuaihaiense]|nr:hypothetical protein [Bradyrhizobium huanghuaihaiense]